MVPIQRTSPWFAALTTALVAAAPASAVAGSPAEPHRAIVFAPDRPERCDFFFVTEFNAGFTGGTSQDGVDRYLFTDALGLMRNVDRSRAVGASIDAHLTGGAIRFAPTVRYKQWLIGRSSLDLTLGYTTAAIDQEGVVGPIVHVRYSPTSWFQLQAGACRVRNVTSSFYYPYYHVNQTTRTHVFAGAGLGGLPGVLSWGAQAIGILALAAALSGMN